MPNLFNSINLNAEKTVASTFDYKLLDTVCDHQVLNEQVVANFSNIFSSPVYSGGSIYSNGSSFSGGINPDGEVIITTKLPLGATDIQFFELPTNSVSIPIVQEFVVPSGVDSSVLTQRFTLAFPPIPNTVTAQQKTTSIDYDGEEQTIYFDFVNYSLSQLFGIIQFNSISDMGSTIQFSYVGDIKQIFPKAKDYSPNWEFLGYNQNGLGVFKIYGRSFIASGSKLIIRYKTTASTCMKCGGDSLINDLDFNNSKNQYYLVYDFSKMIQDFFKRFLTRSGSNVFDRSDGTQIPIIIGLSKNNPLLVDTLIKTETLNLINVIRKKQAVQIPVQGISLSEQLGQINNLTVTKVGVTDVNLIIELQSLSNSTSQIQTIIRGT